MFKSFRVEGRERATRKAWAESYGDENLEEFG
jgi:hypothetical protein